MSSPTVPGPPIPGAAAAARAGAPTGPAGGPWRPPPAPPKPVWVTATEPRVPVTPPLRVLGAAIGAGLFSAVLMSHGLGLNLLLFALAAGAAAALAARAGGRRARPWTVLWIVSALVLAAVPAFTDAGWPVFLAVAAALGVASLALHGGTRWAGVLLGPLGVWAHVLPSLFWAAGSARGRSYPAKAKVLPVLKAVLVALVLLVVFGALFASADAAVADLLDGLTPGADLSDLPARLIFFWGGLLVALGAAHTAAAPRRWDRLPVKPARERGRTEWAIPMVALNLLFGGFVAIQAVVLFGGYEAVMSKPGLVPAEYARQGFWQLLWVTVLTLAVVALAQRWAPRRTAADRLLAKSLIGLLCALTLVVVATAYYRMQRYVDAFGLTRLRISVTAVELWLGVVLLLVLVGVLLGARRWLPRAVVLSAVVGVSVFGLIRPDALIAEQNVTRFEAGGSIDLDYLRGLSADAVPALDRLPGDRRTCALQEIAAALTSDRDRSWYATSLAEARAAELLRARPVPADRDACARFTDPGASAAR
ncbi:DUF4173 domain-containing protein [Kitasatospora sp. NBC_00070]|uniref:DUF4153 domain-containing protein n=1 Tax=Kitasatospora sp. NBC_00070 TaxID=2975962 RepID=UPI00324402EF